MDDESGESMERMQEMPLKEMGEAELERLVRGWRRGTGSWFQRRGEAYWKERSVIRKQDDVDGRARVTKDEERVLWGGWTVMRLYRYEGWVVVPMTLNDLFIRLCSMPLWQDFDWHCSSRSSSALPELLVAVSYVFRIRPTVSYRVPLDFRRNASLCMAILWKHDVVYKTGSTSILL